MICNNPPYNALRVRKLPNQITDVNINSWERRQWCLCGATGNYCRNCPHTKAGWGRDDNYEGKKDAVTDPVLLEYGWYFTAKDDEDVVPVHRMDLGTKVRFKVIPHHIMMRDHPLFLSLNQYLQHRKKFVVLKYCFLLGNYGIVQVKNVIINMYSIIFDHEVIMAEDSSFLFLVNPQYPTTSFIS